MKRACLALVFACAALASAQQSDVERYVREHQRAIVGELMELVAIPNVRSDLPNITRNAELLRRMLDRRGLKPEVWETPSTPLVFGERLVPGATRTILFYTTTTTSTPTTRTCASGICGTALRRLRRS